MGLQLFTLTISLISIVISIFAILVNSGRNKIQRNNFNVNRLTGEANKRLWIRLIVKFIKENWDHINEEEGVLLDKKETIDKWALSKYHELLILAVDTSLKNEGVIECFEKIFKNELKDSYYINKKKNKNTCQ